MNLSTSIRKLTLLFVVLFMALSAGLVYWQVVVAQQVTSNPHNNRGNLPDSAPQRGNIYDRNGVLLAETVRTSTGALVRHYTDSSLAGLIGYYVPGYPATGIEAQFNDYLNGQVGSTALNNAVNKMLHRPPVGDNIYLTIDSRIQKIANQDFDTQVVIDNVTTFATNRGSVVVTDPHTGDVLAMVSRPSFDPNKLVQTLSGADLTYFNQLNQDPDQPLLERPIHNTYVPGSVYKTVTLMAGLDSQKASLNQQFGLQQAFGPVQVGNHNVGDNQIGSNLMPYTIHVPVTTQYGYTHSDNVIFAQIGAETGVDTWLNYNKRFYVTQNIPFDLPVAMSTVNNKDTPLDTNLLADDAFGQGQVLVTPFQMSLVDDIPANGGQLMQPRLISKIVDPNKTALVQNQPQTLGDHQISGTVAQQVLQSMYSVTQCGSGLVAGVNLNQSPWGIIAKTGTAQLGVINGGTIHAHSWLITSAPYSVQNPNQMPALTIVAMKENGGEGGGANAPMVKNMYNDIFSQGLIKVQQPPAVNPNYCCQSGMLQAGCPGVTNNVPFNFQQHA